MRANFCLALIFGVLITQNALALDSVRIRVVGREHATVTTSGVRLSDLAQIDSSVGADDEVIIGLQKVSICEAPKPGESVQLSADKILNKLREQGVSLSQIGYSFPQSVTITRAGRMLESDELFRVISQHLETSGRDITLRKINYNKPLMLAPGDVNFTVKSYETGRSGQIGLSISASVPGADTERFDLSADVEEWKEVQIATRNLTKGETVGVPDIAKARLNANAIGRDGNLEFDQILGMEVSRSIVAGEPFSAAKLAVPPIILAGSKVNMVFKGRLFEASATGIAMQPAIPGQMVKIKNESSKKVITAIAIEPGLVEVRQ